MPKKRFSAEQIVTLLRQAIIGRATQYGRYGYRRITRMLNDTGWSVGTDRVSRIWRREGLKARRNKGPEAGCGSMMAPASG